MMRGRKKQAILTVSIPKEWHKELHRIAETEFVSVSDVVRGQIKKILSSAGTNVHSDYNTNEHGGSTDA